MHASRPVSRHHVLAVTPLLATLPTHLVKTLMCLAAHADHSTGRSFPGQRVMAEWGINYKTWHRQINELTELGLVKQVVRGNGILYHAAEYELLFVPPLTSKTPTTTQGEGGYKATEKQKNPQGERLTRERTPWPELTTFESAQWVSISASLRSKLGLEDVAQLNEQIHSFDQLIPLQRTAVRLVQQGHRVKLLDALTERRVEHLPVYSGADNVPAAMFARLRRVAEGLSIRVWDRDAVTPQDVNRFQAGWNALGLPLPGSGANDTRQSPPDGHC